eukprot:TRINITY_DN66634_c7_g7_i2.p1 TRINITY_DN66634_c7_g7~~TRINITY_DN66634_c7_g7_i2.p1  ORF type:complete len:450 (+),score=26.98 TRINITY_DN66634_c7_g7_i2:124-1350(+)
MPSVCSPATIKVLKDTLPAVAEAGVGLTQRFYERMFKNHPELHNVFNISHQRSGQQPKALFSAVALAATAVAETGELKLPPTVVNTIVHKHCSLLVQPEAYNIVAENLIGAIEELMNPGKAVLDGWGELYWVVANALIAAEKAQYDLVASKRGGWYGRRDFQVARKVREADHIMSLHLRPVDGNPIVEFDPGQFITLWLKGADWEYTQPRQYSLSEAPAPDHYRITVKEDPAGSVSRYIHGGVLEGQVIPISPPFGCFTLSAIDRDAPLALISAGAGMTPMMSMLQTILARQADRKVQWLHATDQGREHMFRDFLIATAKENENFDRDVWYAHPDPLKDQKGVGKHYQHEGFVNLNDVREKLADPKMHYLLCGPHPFMESCCKQLKEWGVGLERIHYEHFGSSQAMAA